VSVGIFYKVHTQEYITQVDLLENGKSGIYKISRKLFMFINKATISKNAKAYIDFILSREGQILIKEAGFISL